MSSDRQERWLVYHPLLQADRNLVAAMREEFLPLKGKLRGIAVREPFEQAMEHVPAPDMSFQEDCIGNIPGWWCLPDGAPENRALLFVHGGAFALGSAKAFRNFAGHLALRAGLRTFLPDYRLAPEHRFPAALQDVEAAYKGLYRNGYKTIGLAGDSTGGGLALSLARLLVDQESRPTMRPAAVVVFSPWIDLALASSTWHLRPEADPIFMRDQLEEFAAMYLGTTVPTHSLASPLYGSFAGLPPVQIHVGEDEGLLDDSLRYAHAAANAGVDVHAHVWEKMHHVFPSAVSRLHTADQALALAAIFLADYALRNAGENSVRIPI